jgi:hypothetical protein
MYGFAMADTDKENRTTVNVIIASAILFYRREKNIYRYTVSNQMSSSLIVLRRTIRWYYNVTFEVLFGRAVVNAQNLSM